MIKVMVALHKLPAVTRDDFRRYWREVHGPIGAAMPAVRRYVQNHATADGAPFDGIAEMWFDDLAGIQAAFTSPQAAEAAKDTPNFCASTQVVMVEEIEMTLPANR